MVGGELCPRAGFLRRCIYSGVSGILGWGVGKVHREIDQKGEMEFAEIKEVLWTSALEHVDVVLLSRR